MQGGRISTGDLHDDEVEAKQGQLLGRFHHEMQLAQREDLADWLSTLLGCQLRQQTLLKSLESGEVLCRLAARVNAAEHKAAPLRRLPAAPEATRGSNSFQARDTMIRFLAWARGLGIAEGTLFEPDDLVDHKNEKQVLNCLMEIARLARALPPPRMVQMERDLDQPMTLPVAVHDQVQRLAAEAGVRLEKGAKAGTYVLSDTSQSIFVRILRQHVVVRVGGGWDTLNNFLHVHLAAKAGLNTTLALAPGADADTAANVLRQRHHHLLQPPQHAPVACATASQGQLTVHNAMAVESYNGVTPPSARRRPGPLPSPFLMEPKATPQEQPIETMRARAHSVAQAATPLTPARGARERANSASTTRPRPRAATFGQRPVGTTLPQPRHKKKQDAAKR